MEFMNGYLIKCLQCDRKKIKQQTNYLKYYELEIETVFKNVLFIHVWKLTKLYRLIIYKLRKININTTINNYS